MVRLRETRYGLAARQRGATMLGYIILATFVGLFVFGAIRLTPVYLNYMKVSGVIDGVAEEFDGQGASRASIAKSLSRRFDVDAVSQITARDVKIAQVDGGWEVAAVYDHPTPFIANISFTVHFDKRRVVRR
jgi:hypothetical protein